MDYRRCKISKYIVTGRVLRNKTHCEVFLVVDFNQNCFRKISQYKILRRTVQWFKTSLHSYGQTDGRTGKNLNTRKTVWRLNVTVYAATYHIIKKLGKLLTKYFCVFCVILSLRYQPVGLFSSWQILCAVWTESFYRMYSLRAGRSGDRIPVRTRFSTTVETSPGAHPVSYTMGTGSLPGVKCGRVVTLTTHPHQAPRLKKE